MDEKSFNINNDTVVWMVFVFWLFTIVVSYNIGRDNGIKTEKIGWLEDQQLKTEVKK